MGIKSLFCNHEWEIVNSCQVTEPSIEAKDSLEILVGELNKVKFELSELINGGNQKYCINHSVTVSQELIDTEYNAYNLKIKLINNALNKINTFSKNLKTTGCVTHMVCKKCGKVKVLK